MSRRYTRRVCGDRLVANQSDRTLPQSVTVGTGVKWESLELSSTTLSTILRKGLLSTDSPDYPPFFSLSRWLRVGSQESDNPLIPIPISQGIETN
jgi:hypothetical protein